MKEVHGSVELIEYHDHSSVEVSLRNHEFYTRNLIIIHSIGLVIHEDEEQIHLLHEVLIRPSPLEAHLDDKAEMGIHVIVKGTIIKRVVLRKDVKINMVK